MTKQKKREHPDCKKDSKQLFGKTNRIIFFIALFLLMAGYLCLKQEPVDGPLSITVAPVLLVLCYLVLFPLAILFKDRK